MVAVPLHVALVADRGLVPADELAAVAAALQKQVLRDFGPAWGVQASVDAFAPDQIPHGYLPIIVKDSLDLPGIAGYHTMPADGMPYALIEHGPSWSLSASHECLEMLADPSGMRTISSLTPDGGERVDLLVEVCDACQDPAYAYPVNGIAVSDFCLPRFYDPGAAAGTPCSFTGAVTAPRSILKNGYVSWITEARSLVQSSADDDGNVSTATIGDVAARGSRALREFVDSLDRRNRALSRLRLPPRLEAAFSSAEAARARRSARILAEVDRLCAAGRPEAPRPGSAKPPRPRSRRLQ